MSDLVRQILKTHRPGKKRQRVYDYFVAYLVPTWLWQRWHEFYWDWMEKNDD